MVAINELYLVLKEYFDKCTVLYAFSCDHIRIFFPDNNNIGIIYDIYINEGMINAIRVNNLSKPVLFNDVCDLVEYMNELMK